jgi:hypothetical protein
MYRLKRSNAMSWSEIRKANEGILEGKDVDMALVPYVCSDSDEETPDFADTDDEDSKNVIMKTSISAKGNAIPFEPEFVILKELQELMNPCSYGPCPYTFRVNKSVRF